MSSKVILVLIDGLAWQAAHDGMGYLQGLCEADQACLYQLQCALPSLSRPLYECILSGMAPVHSGIVHNDAVPASSQQSLFHLARDAGLATAAAAYCWIAELYNRAPYVAVRDRFTDDSRLPIQHGVFYHGDDYPDDHVLLDAEALRLKHQPDFLLVHPMETDVAGHRHGYDSAQYRNSARRIDKRLAEYLPGWLAAGYQVLITSDHGMNRDGSHGGLLPEERLVPLFVFGQRFSKRPDIRVQQTELCGLAADLLGLRHTKPRNPELLLS
ncbi:alkaline phosphatase family protein [Pseudogulbenkiania sp. MAI-1]|uniref:alkaline phosphatase family protein n=1 Tax=Pseudogulbenkiania sp. MAI-1 TaxID=990370 RepID=UPI00045E6C22|nr:alkaline phosphatase family protein [Pseudogulbenkiania sp. MAI-1]